MKIQVSECLMSYMIETDVPVCVSICLDIHVGIQDQNIGQKQVKQDKYTMDPA